MDPLILNRYNRLTLRIVPRTVSQSRWPKLAGKRSDLGSQVDHAIERQSRSWRSRKNQIMVLATVLLVAGAGMIGVAWHTPTPRIVPFQDPVSPYLNTRPDVKYLGDARCVGCHPGSAETFRQHPMGRSFAPIDDTTVKKADEGSSQALFESQGLEYSIERRDGHVLHQETRRDATGRIIARTEAEVQFVLGFGRQGAAYLVERGGFLFESPLTWYARTGRWGLSPGFDVSNHHFDRPINPNCLFCHANRVEREPAPASEPRPLVFHGHAIGCERCHGPGELHVARPVVVGGHDMTIVDPAGLTPALRDDVCAVPPGRRAAGRAGRTSE